VVHTQVVGGELRDLHDIKYLLSPQDLMAVELVPDLIRAGVSCFKIEGRLKGPEYVALTTKVYRDAVDTAWERLQGEGGATAGKQQPLLTKEVALELAQVCCLHASCINLRLHFAHTSQARGAWEAYARAWMPE
jgi:putative protease